MRRDDDGDVPRTRWWMTLGALVLGLALAAPATVRAQGGGDREVDDETAKKVLKLLKKGKKEYEAEDFQQAYTHFEEAYELWPRPEIQARLGKAAEEMGNTDKALQHYRAYLDEAPSGEMAKDVRENIKGLTGKMPATVSVRSTPAGATVYLGSKEGEELGTTPLEASVPPGQKTFVFEAEGYETTTRSWSLKGGQQRSFTVQLTSRTEGGEQPQAFGEPSDSMSTDTEGSEKTKGGGLNLGTVGWIVGGVGVAGLGTGAVFSYLQGQTVQEAELLDRRNTERSEFERLKRSAQRHYETSLIFYGVGGGLTAIGAGLLVYHHFLKGGSKEQNATLRLRFGPAPTGRGGMAGVRLSF